MRREGGILLLAEYSSSRLAQSATSLPTPPDARICENVGLCEG